MTCPNCGAAAAPGSGFCGECGAKLSEPSPSCSNCGTVASPEDAFCQSCGSPLGAASPSPDAAPAPPPPQEAPPPPPPVQEAPPPPPPAQEAPPPPPQFSTGAPGMPPPPPPPTSPQSYPPPPPHAPAAPAEQGGGFLIPVGYLGSLLGGLLGLAIGGALWQSKQQDPSGSKTPKYNPATRRHGIAMIVLGSVALAVTTQVADQMNPFAGGGTPDGPPAATGGAVGGSPAGGGETGAQPSRPTAGGGSEQPGGGQPSRPSTGGGASPASLGLSPNAQPANDFEELVLAYLDTAYVANLQDEGFGPAIHRQFGSLADGATEDVSFRLPASADIAIFGTCDNECSDMNFMLFSEEGRLVDQDNLDDDIPLVVAETPSSVQRYTLRVEMASCSIAPCYYAVGIYRR